MCRPGDFGFWQGALRDAGDPLFDELKQAVTDRTRITVDLLYGDHEGGQRTVSRFSLLAVELGGWRLSRGSRRWPAIAISTALTRAESGFEDDLDGAR